MAKEYKPYEKYKATNIFWATSIPVNWKEIKIKHLFSERSEKDFPNEPLLSATQRRGVIPTALFETRTVVATKGLETLKLVEIGDFVISLRSFQGGIEYAYYHGIISPAYTVMIPQSRIYKGYFKYLAKSYLFIDLLKTCVTGIREGQNINYSLLKKSYLPVPSLDEQIQIERFLDIKIAKVNKFIKDKKREIESLKEQIECLCYSASDISKTITSWDKAFDPNWKLTKAKRLFDEINIKNRSTEELLAVTQDRGVVYKKDCTQNYVSPSGSLDGLKLVKDGDFVISLRSFQGGIEYSFCRGIVSPAYNVFELKQRFQSPELQIYFRFLFKTKPFIELLKTLGGGIRDGKNISFSVFSEFYMPIPAKEQLLLISEVSKKLDVLQKQKIQLFYLMNEYKTSLISEVVTGKVDVRDVKIEEVFEMETLEEVEVEAVELTEE